MEKQFILEMASFVRKEGRKMPAVKKRHLESDNTSKPDWIRGHYEGVFMPPIRLC